MSSPAPAAFSRGSTAIHAVEAVDLVIELGEFVALEGPSGSGKTTFLQLRRQPCVRPWPPGAAAAPADTSSMERLPWEKQRDESGQAFAAFAKYRDLGVRRSILKASQVHHDDTPNAASVESLKAHFGKWSSRWNWVARAEAYDLYLDERNRTRLEARRDEILERVGQSGQALSYVAIRALAGDVEAGIEPLDPRKLAPADVVRFMRTAAELELRSLGQVIDAKGAFVITPAQVTNIVGAILDTALKYIPEEREEAFLRHASLATTGHELP